MTDGPYVIIASIHAKPGSEDALIAALNKAQVPTHEEEGCARYAMHRDVDDPSHFVFVEQWASDAAIDSHMETAHIQEVVAALGDLVAEAPTLTKTKALPFGDPVKGAL